MNRHRFDHMLDVWATWLWLVFKVLGLSLVTGFLCGLLYAAGQLLWNKVLA